MTGRRLHALFDRAGAEGFLHACEIDGAREVGLGEDAPVVSASVFKVPVALAFFADCAAGRLDPMERVRLEPGRRTRGPTGISTLRDAVDVSLRDLASLMLTISDNAATDVVLARVGVKRVNALLRDLGLRRTVLVGGCRDLLDGVARHAGYETLAAWEDAGGAVDDEERLGVAFRPDATTRTTAREATRLLRLIWRDEAGPPTACAEVRALMAAQLTRHWIAAGFAGTGATISAKTGGLFGVVRNEIAAIEYSDGGRYAVAVFTRAHRRDPNQPAIDATIGSAARLAVEHLRS